MIQWLTNLFKRSPHGPCLICGAAWKRGDRWFSVCDDCSMQPAAELERRFERTKNGHNG